MVELSLSVSFVTPVRRLPVLRGGLGITVLLELQVLSIVPGSEARIGLGEVLPVAFRLFLGHLDPVAGSGIISQTSRAHAI
jgi:hypothetical protein